MQRWEHGHSSVENSDGTPTTNESGTRTEKKLRCSHSMDLGILDTRIYEAVPLGG